MSGSVSEQCPKRCPERPVGSSTRDWSKSFPNLITPILFIHLQHSIWMAPLRFPAPPMLAPRRILRCFPGLTVMKVAVGRRRSSPASSTHHFAYTAWSNKWLSSVVPEKCASANRDIIYLSMSNRVWNSTLTLLQVISCTTGKGWPPGPAVVRIKRGL